MSLPDSASRVSDGRLSSGEVRSCRRPFAAFRRASFVFSRSFSFSHAFLGGGRPCGETLVSVVGLCGFLRRRVASFTFAGGGRKCCFRHSFRVPSVRWNRGWFARYAFLSKRKRLSRGLRGVPSRKRLVVPDRKKRIDEKRVRERPQKMFPQPLPDPVFLRRLAAGGEGRRLVPAMRAFLRRSDFEAPCRAPVLFPDMNRRLVRAERFPARGAGIPPAVVSPPMS